MPSGYNLKQLIQNEIHPILRKEDGNREAMHLYSLGTYWVAFETSAFQLACRCAGASIIPLRIREVPHPVLAACVHRKDLPACSQRLERMTLPAPHVDMGRYRQWREKKLEWFLEDMEKVKNRKA